MFPRGANQQRSTDLLIVSNSFEEKRGRLGPITRFMFREPTKCLIRSSQTKIIVCILSAAFCCFLVGPSHAHDERISPLAPRDFCLLSPYSVTEGLPAFVVSDHSIEQHIDDHRAKNLSLPHLDFVEGLMLTHWLELFDEFHANIPHLSPSEEEWLDAEKLRNYDRYRSSVEYSIKQVSETVHLLESFGRHKEWPKLKSEMEPYGLNLTAFWFKFIRDLREAARYEIFDEHLVHLLEEGIIPENTALTSTQGWNFHWPDKMDNQSFPYKFQLLDKAKSLEYLFVKCRFGLDYQEPEKSLFRE